MKTQSRFATAIYVTPTSLGNITLKNTSVEYMKAQTKKITLKHQEHPNTWPPKSRNGCHLSKRANGTLQKTYLYPRQTDRNLPGQKNNTPNILESDLYLSESNSTVNSQNHNPKIDWNKYHINSYGYLTEKKTYHPETYHHYESWEQYTTNNYSYLEKTSNKNHRLTIDLTNDESIIDLCTSNTTVC
ncbi:unnamed protein product [Mytilus coruscus]|uniref:Uncharacterized protein n=1 Tax=Mytilus coruscus TaxID=42192 RepID=A0A6J8AIQ9_MYTCO|nr:unnamed protein product [Mytilus coruscus]